VLPRTVDRRNTHVTAVTRDDNNACVTAAVRMLLNQADARSRGKLGMERAAKCKHDVLVRRQP